MDAVDANEPAGWEDTTGSGPFKAEGGQARGQSRIICLKWGSTHGCARRQEEARV